MGKKFTDKIAVITGASSGMGREFALRIDGEESFDEIWLIARRTERLEEIASSCKNPARAISMDLTKSEAWDEYKRMLESENADVRVLVNAAGFGYFKGFLDMDLERQLAMIDLNDKALVLITHMTIPYMERGGRIIELGSGSCFTPLPNFNIYASSKIFVLHYTKALNYEIKKYGLRATCFCPGWVETEFLGKATARPTATVPKEMKPMLKCEDVVKRCVKASIKGKTMCVTNWYTKLQHLLFKTVPDNLLTNTWMGMQKEPEAEKNGKN